MIKINYNEEGKAKGKLGKHCFIYRGEALEPIKKELGRDNICLKVFYDQDRLGNWGDDPKKDPTDKRNTTIGEATLIQNICWYFGLAPRVYKLTQVEWTGRYRKVVGDKKVCDARVVDYVEGEFNTLEEIDKIYEKIVELGKEFGWKPNYKDFKKEDCINGKFLDFQLFNSTTDYKTKLKEAYYKYGTYGKKYYHNVPELGLTGCPRENENRIKWLGLDKLDWKGKKVVDLGCANGWFTRWLDKQGARVTGVDTKTDSMKDPLLSAWLVACLLAQYNIDYKEQDLRDIDAEGDYDVALFLSVTFHLGVPQWLNKIAKLVIVEDNSKDKDAETYLKLLFKKVERKGETTDRNSVLPIYYCYKDV